MVDDGRLEDHTFDPPGGGVTVIVPTLNRGGFLRDCLVDLLAQNHRPLEILVVDQSDQVSPEIAELVAANPDVVVHRRVVFRGLPQARNYGWQHASHEAIVYVDDDIRCGPELAGEHLRGLSLPGVGLVAGGIDEANKPADLAGGIGSYSHWTATPTRGFGGHGHRDVKHVPGGNFSVWREVIRTAGGVDEMLSVGSALYEETDLALRVGQLGYRAVFNGDARLTHLAAASDGCRTEDVVRYVRGLAHNRAVLIRRHGRWFHRPTAVVRLLVLGASYARYHRRPLAVGACLKGLVSGWVAAGNNPACTGYAVDGRPS